jgi:hypothetical protein
MDVAAAINNASTEARTTLRHVSVVALLSFSLFFGIVVQYFIHWRRARALAVSETGNVFRAVARQLPACFCRRRFMLRYESCGRPKSTCDDISWDMRGCL